MPIITIQRAIDFFEDEENVLKDIIFPERTPIPYLPEVLDEVEDEFDVHDMVVNIQQRIGEPRRFIIRENGDVVEEEVLEEEVLEEEVLEEEVLEEEVLEEEYEYEDKTFEDDYFSDDDGYDSDGYGMTPSFL